MSTYLLACFVMGLGIAIDVAIASIAQAAQLRSAGAMRRWVVRITATHVTFPMIGYYGALRLERVAEIRFALGLVAFLLIAIFLWRMLRRLIHVPSDLPSIEPAAEPGWVLVLAVSWDALWSGPAKAAQAAAWSPLQVVFSFPLAGVVVAVAAILSTLFAQRLRESALRSAGSAARQARFEQLGVMVEIAVFAYFGFLALFAFSLDLGNAVLPAAVSALGVAALVHISIGGRIAAALRRAMPTG